MLKWLKVWFFFSISCNGETTDIPCGGNIDANGDLYSHPLCSTNGYLAVKYYWLEMCTILLIGCKQSKKTLDFDHYESVGVTISWVWICKSGGRADLAMFFTHISNCHLLSLIWKVSSIWLVLDLTRPSYANHIANVEIQFQLHYWRTLVGILSDSFDIVLTFSKSPKVPQNGWWFLPSMKSVSWVKI